MPSCLIFLWGTLKPRSYGLPHKRAFNRFTYLSILPTVGSEMGSIRRIMLGRELNLFTAKCKKRFLFSPCSLLRLLYKPGCPIPLKFQYSRNDDVKIENLVAHRQKLTVQSTWLFKALECEEYSEALLGSPMSIFLFHVHLIGLPHNDVETASLMRKALRWRWNRCIRWKSR